MKVDLVEYPAGEFVVTRNLVDHSGVSRVKKLRYCHEQPVRWAMSRVWGCHRVARR